MKHSTSLPLDARRSRLGLKAVLALAVSGAAAGQALPEQTRFSTHDTTVEPGNPGFPAFEYGEYWADVKTPGDGWAYSVGSIEVRDTGVAGPVFFSGVAADPALTLPPFGVAQGAMDRQVVMLQQAGVADDSIGFQRFFYGENMQGQLWATTARGIAVWPDPDPLEQRIVICGESFDELLPASNVPTGWTGANGTATAGFIALFNGAGDLLWSHQFFGPLVDGQCAITDVAIRVGVDGLGNPIDVVTFCGLSNYGNPVQNDTLTTVRPFAAPPVSPPPSSSCANSTAGDTDNGPGQFDGIVGVLSHPHSLGAPSAATTTVEYLSVVGGIRDDALFGIAEIDETHFAVVGSTGGGASGTGNGAFPVTFEPLACPNASSPGAGVICVFRTDPASLSLVLEVSQLIRSGNAGVGTAAKDVLMQRSWGPNGEPGLIVVGATTDPQLLTQVNWGSPVTIGPDATLGGTQDGFVLAGELYLGASPTSPVPVVSWTHGTYQGTDAADYATGVQGWNEYYDHFVVAGTWTTEPSPGVQNEEIVVASYYRPPSQTGPFVPLVQLGSVIIGGLDADRPAALGLESATGNNNFSTIGTAAGGGVAVDANARVSVVGATYVQSYMAPPYSMSTFPTTQAPNPAGRASMSTAVDAVRASFDLLPSNAVAGAFVGRTDGTGPIQGPPGGPVGGYPTANWSGATTPECAITPFGHQIGVADPQAAPALPRMLIDWAGPTPAPGVTFDIVISRHPQQTNSGFSLVALQFGLPGDPDLFPALLPGGAEVWVPQSTVQISGVANPNWQSMRFPVGLPPQPASGFLTLQGICVLLNPVTGGAAPACATTSYYAATPALWLSY